MKKIAPKSSNVQIRFYNSLPLDFTFRLDNRLFVGPYIYGKQSQQTISYEFSGKSEGYKYYQTYFDELWNDQTFCHTK